VTTTQRRHFVPENPNFLAIFLQFLPTIGGVPPLLRLPARGSGSKLAEK
jgi:hypothetical protein